jgi:hypothetical protein
MEFEDYTVFSFWAALNAPFEEIQNKKEKENCKENTIYQQ